MRQIAKYVNHKGESVELNGKHVRLNSGQLQDWALSYSTVNGRSGSFRRSAKEVPIAAVVMAKTNADGIAARNALYEVAIVDVEANKPGRLYVGDWYMEGYFVSSSKGRWWLTDRAADYSLSFLADTPLWTRERTFSFYPIREDSTIGLNFEHDYAHDYSAFTAGSNLLDNGAILPAPAKIIIYGAAVNPRITIGGNTYAVDTAVPDGGILTIDAPTRTIVKRDRYGAVSNCFHHRAGNQRRGGGSYIFESIAPGINEVSWDGSFGFDVTLYEQRDEWRWE